MRSPKISVLALTCIAVLTAQTTPTFDAASIKPADPKSAPLNASPEASATLKGGPGTADPGRISYANVTLQTLLITAYGSGCQAQVEECDQLIAPAWLHLNRYDIDAKIPPGATPDQFHLMLQNLAAERFHVTVHHETRDLQGYELTAGKGKPKLVQSPEPDAAEPTAGPLLKFGAVGEYPQLVRAGFIISPYKGTRATANHLIAREQTPADIAKMLSMVMHTHVVDKTGLLGKFNFTLDWIPDGVNLVLAPDADPTELTPPHGIPTALEDQLNLKLVKTKLPLDVVVVDTADKIPTEN